MAIAAVITVALEIVDKYLEYQQNQSIEELRGLIDLQNSRFEELTEALRLEFLQLLYKARIDEAVGHIMTAQQDLDIVADAGKTEPWVVDVLDDARDDATTAMNSLGLTLHSLGAPTSQSQDEDQIYVDIIGAVFSNVLYAGTLTNTALTTLGLSGWPDCSSRVVATFRSELELADAALTSIRNMIDGHYRYEFRRIYDGPTLTNQYGFREYGSFVSVAEVPANKPKLNAQGKKDALDLMNDTRDSRFLSFPEVQLIQAGAQKIEGVLDASQTKLRRAAIRERISAYTKLRREVSTA